MKHQTRIAQVKDFNAIVDVYGLDRAYIMTVGDGSMFEKPRVKGWVVFQSPKLGDKHDFARWFKSKELAMLDLKGREAEL